MSMTELVFMENDALWESYGSWLLAECRFRKRGYSKLMQHLHLMVFEWVHPMDENRAGDGMEHRYYFLRSLGGNAPSDLCEKLQKRPCSMLEMLVGLAIRIDGDYVGDVNSPRPDLLICEFLENWGLMGGSTKAKNRGFTCEFVNSRVLSFRNSQVNSQVKNVDFGPFPVEKPEKYPYNSEIWSLLHQYLFEKH